MILTDYYKELQTDWSTCDIDIPLVWFSSICSVQVLKQRNLKLKLVKDLFIAIAVYHVCTITADISFMHLLIYNTVVKNQASRILNVANINWILLAISNTRNNFQLY